MSISFSGPDLQPTYQAIIDGTADYDWALFNQTANELKVQGTGNGLDDLEEEFMDGRIQYAFARVRDPNSSLDKFILIAWCGEGVPESRKGLFHTHMSQVSSKFLKGAHLVIQARSELDVTPAHIHKRIQESSGSKYSSSAAGPTRSAPVASKPTPSFRPSQGLGGSQGKPASVSTPASTFNRPTPSAPAASAPKPAPPPREPSPPPPAPATPTPAAAPPAPPVNRPPSTVSASTPAPSEASKPSYEDRIAPVGTAYEPVKLATPGKLANRWNPAANKDDDSDAPATGGSVKDRMAAFSGGGSPSPAAAIPSPSGKKLTWSERQAEAKRQREEEERSSSAASVAAGVGIGAASGAAVGVASAAISHGSQATESSSPPPAPRAPSAPSVPSAPAPPPMPARGAIPPRPASPDSDEEKEEEDDWGSPPPPAPPAPPFRPEPVVEDDPSEPVAPPPPPPPPPPPFAQSSDPQVDELQRLKEDLTLEQAPPAGAPPPVPLNTRPKATPPAQAGLRAKAVYEYEAAEDNEISFAEDEIITQIEQLDEGWWSGTNAAGKSGLFPSNYVEAIEDDAAPEAEEEVAPPPPPPPPPAPPAPPVPPAAAVAEREAEEEEAGEVLIAQYDYDAAEDNEISFKEGDRITNIEKVDTDWWQGQANGKEGLFPAAYVVSPDEYQPS